MALQRDLEAREDSLAKGDITICGTLVETNDNNGLAKYYYNTEK